jgi:hypothetical protein
MAGKPGTPSKGPRKPSMVRAPDQHHARYLQESQRLGLPLGDYLVLVLAQAHGLQVPDYIERKLDKGQLPLGA